MWDAGLVEAVVCLANAEAGQLVSGMLGGGASPDVHRDHRTQGLGLAGLLERVRRALQPVKREQIVLRHVRQHGHIKLAEVKELCHLSEGQVKSFHKRLCNEGLLILKVAGPAAHYRIGAADRMALDQIG